MWSAAVGISGCATHSEPSTPREEQVVFVCEHGNVKSLMAASYFNEMATARGLNVQAISRGSAPNSTTVPTAIAEGLRRDGFDVLKFEPRGIIESDVVLSKRIVLINTEMPVAVPSGSVPVERWSDVPAANADFAAAREALREHVRELVEELIRTEDHLHDSGTATEAKSVNH
jgi:arsenate reductase (thioredoxin)